MKNYFTIDNSKKMARRWDPRTESQDSWGGWIGDSVAGENILELKIFLPELKNGVSEIFPGVKIPKGFMISKTDMRVITPGVGAASVDVGVKGNAIGSTYLVEDGLIGGCPVTDEGELHEHFDEQASAIGIIMPETVDVTVKAGGDFTEGFVVFRVYGRSSADKNVPLIRG